MNKRQRVAYIQRTLQELYPNPPIPLKHKDAYTLLIAVILSAQCLDSRVNQITPLLFDQADTPTAMIKMSIEDIKNIIRPCGLGGQKAQGIWRLSRILQKKHQGKVPDTFDDLESLPAVGHKTASVVMAQAFGHPSMPVDTHIHRLAQRWGLSGGISVKQTEKDLKRLFPKERWNAIHLQFIYYARAFCSATKCDGRVCSICKATYPNRKKPFVHRKA